ncbi:hypothetical protein VRZ08_21340 [Rhodopseudomonas sp. G2_2311]|uniref:hypothetical protein n=1 Tax=Rhodopseudomonas sp. G2_2311 TaxID=3114287 RepID=UPI0039C6C1A7
MDGSAECCPSRSHRNAFQDASFWGATAFGTILSIAITGYAFPDNNNVFHLPIVGELYNLPELAADPYIQSLRHFASGLWMILEGSARWIDPRLLFFILLLASRALSLIGFLLCADWLGIRDAGARYVFAALVATSALMQIDSVAGGGGLFIRNFTHSELPNGIFLIALWCILTGRFRVALMLIGPTFFLNAFFAVWQTFILAIVLLNEVLSGRQRIRDLIPDIAIGAMIGILFAIPILQNIIRNPDFGARLDFNYIDYVGTYYFRHFLFWPIRPWEKVTLLCVVGVTLYSLRLSSDPQNRLLVTVWACIALYVIGIFVPAITSNPTIINLHLLRSSTLIQLQTVLLASVVITRWWFSNSNRAIVLASLAMVGMAIAPIGPLRLLGIGSLVAIFAIQQLVERYPNSWPAPWLLWDARVVRAAALVALTLVAGATILVNQWRIARDSEWIVEWDQVARWARRDTAAGSVFLVPVFSFTKTYTGKDLERQGAILNGAFEYTAHRSLWIDFKRGANVMWSPSDYHRWRERTEAVEQLSTHQERLEYAMAHGIPYVIEFTMSNCSEQPVFRTGRICVFRSML